MLSLGSHPRLLTSLLCRRYYPISTADEPGAQRGRGSCPGKRQRQGSLFEWPGILPAFTVFCTAPAWGQDLSSVRIRGSEPPSCPFASLLPDLPKPQSLQPRSCFHPRHVLLALGESPLPRLCLLLPSAWREHLQKPFSQEPFMQRRDLVAAQRQ